MAYTNDTIGACDSCCQACHLALVGTKLDQLAADLDNGIGYSGDLLTATEISYIENCCEALKRSSFGTLLNAILTASKGYDTASTVSDTIKGYLNGCCEAFSRAEVGTLLQNSVALINAMQEYDESFILTFAFDGYEDYSGEIDDEEETISVVLPYNTNVTALTAEFTTSTGATVLNEETVVESGSGTINYTNPVTLSCISHDESTSLDYVTTVTFLPNVACDFLTFVLAGASGVIDTEAATIFVETPFGTNLASLAPTFTVSAQGTVYVGENLQTSAETLQNFSAPIVYRVLAGDTETYKDFTINATVSAE
ncbi:MAG: hypothetical protein PHS59_18595 [Paludibacter sp.]|nr:hypothetical protein [Paludibacter sp.]